MLSENKAIATRLKQVREHFGHTQKYISKMSGCTLNSWQKYEKAQSVPGGKVLAGLSKLGVNVDWVLIGDGEMMDNEPKGDSPPIPGMPHSREQAKADMYDDLIHNDPAARARRDEQQKAGFDRLHDTSAMVNQACEDVGYSPPAVTRAAINGLAMLYDIDYDHIVMLTVSLKHDQGK